MTWAPAAVSVSEQIEKYGAYAGLAAIVGLAVLSLLYFAQAREVKRLREWAGRAPERAAELEARVATEATRRVSGAPLRPQTAAAQAAAPGAAAAPAAAAAPGATPAPAAKPAADVDQPTVATPAPGLPVAVPAASGAAAAAAGAAPPSSAASPTTTAPAPGAPGAPAATPAPGTNGVTNAPPATGPRVPGRPPPGAAATPAPTPTPAPVPPATAAAATERPPAARPLRSGPPSRTLPPRETGNGDGGGHRPSRRVLAVIGGAVLVLAAVVVVLLVSTGGGDDTPTPPNQVAETTARTTQSEQPARTQSSAQQRVDRADTPVMVLNATGVNGLARQVADRLQSTGYQAAVDNTGSRPQTVIGYKSGAQAAAREIAKLLEVPSGQIQPMPSDLAGIAGDNAVVVVIGADKASD